MSRPERILVVALHNLGDAVMGSALLPPLRRLYPQAELGLWVKEYARELFDFPAGDVHIHAADPFWDRAPGRSKGSLRAFLGAVADIRARKYDLAFVLDSDWRRALACWLAGIPNRVGYRRRKSGLFLTHGVSGSAQGHVIESHARLLSAWRGTPVPLDWLRPEIGLSPDQKSRGSAWRAGLGWRERVVAAMHLISGDPAKDWPLEKWAELIENLRARIPRLGIVVLSAPQEEAALRRALGAAPSGQVQIASGSISRMKDILSQANLFIGGDSGLGHVAAALGVPALSLFGPTDPARYRPVGGGRTMVIRGNPLRGLSAPEAADAVMELLPGSVPPPS